jgi:hypothetical protein
MISLFRIPLNIFVVVLLSRVGKDSVSQNLQWCAILSFLASAAALVLSAKHKEKVF